MENCDSRASHIDAVVSRTPVGRQVAAGQVGQNGAVGAPGKHAGDGARASATGERDASASFPRVRTVTCSKTSPATRLSDFIGTSNAPRMKQAHEMPHLTVAATTPVRMSKTPPARRTQIAVSGDCSVPAMPSAKSAYSVSVIATTDAKVATSTRDCLL